MPPLPASAYPPRPTTSASPASSRSQPAIPLRGSTRAPSDRERQDLWTARLREGDTAALREVIEAFSERITSVVAGMLRDRDAVDDVVQETFVKAYYRIQSFHGDAGLYTWLYRIAINGAKDHVKRRGRRPAMALDDWGDMGAGAGLPSLASKDEPALERLEDRETRLQVRAAIQSLPAKFRAVLVLREIEGLPYEEIAEVLDISQGTVESRLFRARRRLRARLARMDLSS